MALEYVFLFNLMVAFSCCNKSTPGPKGLKIKQKSLISNLIVYTHSQFQIYGFFHIRSLDHYLKKLTHVSYS